MTNLDSILKSRDIILPTKVHLVKAMVFPVVMYGCESWTVKKAERWRIDAFEMWCWRRLLKVPWTAMRSNQSILKEISLEWHPTISSSIVPFSSWPQSFPASGSFPMSRLFASDSQSIGASASASVPPVNIQDWFPLEWTGLLLQSKGFSRVFSNTTFQKHQFFSAQPSLHSNSCIHIGLLESFI